VVVEAIDDVQDVVVTVVLGVFNIYVGTTDVVVPLTKEAGVEDVLKVLAVKVLAVLLANDDETLNDDDEALEGKDDGTFNDDDEALDGDKVVADDRVDEKELIVKVLLLFPV
jgi:hypothetical protein